MSRLPVRMRLTLAFAGVMLIVLALSGVIVYQQFRAQLDRTINLDVSTQASSLLTLADSSGLKAVVRSPLVRGHQNFVQVLDRRGRVVAATPGLEKIALLKGKKLRTALKRTSIVTRGKTVPLPDGSRLLSTPIHAKHNDGAVLIVGTSLDERSSSLSHLSLLLAIVEPAALIIASLMAYRLTAATLRPVELMRSRAAVVSATEPGLRLPLPAADDEIRRLGSTLNEMLTRLEESFAHERVFVAMASHELRTPLSTLRAELDLALRRPRPAAELQEALRSAQSEVDRLTALADDLLVLARADDGRLPVTKVELSVDDVLRAVRDRFGPQADRIRIEPAPGQRMFADPARTEQGLSNLLDNALRYTDGEILLWAQDHRGGGTQLHVQDSGPGFPTEFLVQAFDRFSRADPGRAGRGAGLGLSIVRTIARAQGGDAYAMNRTAGGAEVWIVIPPAPDA